MKAWLLWLVLASGVIAWSVIGARSVPSSAKALLAVPAPTVVEVATSGEALYARHCAACHGDRGEGRFPVFPPLIGSARANGDPKAAIAIVLDGLQGPTEVGGVTYDSVMPGFRDQLTDAEIAATLTHVRMAIGTRAGEVDATDVREVRR